VKVMIVGSGAREHALAARIIASPQRPSVLCVPGNGGTAAIAENVALDPEDVAAVTRLARERGVDFAVIGPEAPLVAGIADSLRAAGIATFGPGRAAAQLEGSKKFSKLFMRKYGVPTASAHIFDDADAAIAHVRAAGQPMVVKADGLAAGKGVIVAASVEETVAAIELIMRKREFGASGATVLLEQRLFGQEVSYHVLLDGNRALPLAAAQDHKRAHDGDLGPNTGGMGAYSPPPVVTAEVERKILERVVEPTVAGLRREDLMYRGVLFIGLMISDGEPYVIEYNTRFGDPETQVLMARYGGDVLALLFAAASGELQSEALRWEAPVAMSVVIAAPGYPGSYPKGLPIDGLAEASAAGVEVHHAGTRREGEAIVSSGGRVLAVTGSGDDLDAVAGRVYAAIERIGLAGGHYRRDIGWHARRR
jgi:phosphoribosylamine--glycine ligase